MRSFPFTPGAYALAWCQGRRWLRKRPDALHRSARMKAGSWCQGCRKFSRYSITLENFCVLCFLIKKSLFYEGCKDLFIDLTFVFLVFLCFFLCFSRK